MSVWKVLQGLAQGNDASEGGSFPQLMFGHVVALVAHVHFASTIIIPFPFTFCGLDPSNLRLLAFESIH